MNPIYFEGWYWRQQSAAHTIALIPAHHRSADGTRRASLQLLTEDAAYQLDFPAAAFSVERTPFRVTLGDSAFTLSGCHIDCVAEGVSFFGDLRYTARVTPPGDIMGPFRFVPGMQCRHSLLSLRHRVDGTLSIDGVPWVFDGGTGYIEGDRGRSFPKRYLWTQCTWAEGSLLLSIADIPFCGGQFVGCIGAILYRGKTIRLGTYFGGRPLAVGQQGATVRQGGLTLSATLLTACPQPLRAPEVGSMQHRTIYESAACTVRYRLERRGEVLFDFVSTGAGFEAEWRDV
ncbi:MAG: hypothetical protein RRY95_00085 [Oscillospiraceae bacterium]